MVLELQKRHWLAANCYLPDVQKLRYRIWQRKAATNYQQSLIIFLLTDSL